MYKRQAMAKVLDFFRDRLKNKLIDDGYNYDTVNAVMNVSELNILRIAKKVASLDKFLEDNEDQISYFTRIVNLSKDLDDDNIREDLLENDLERSFYEVLISLGDFVAVAETDYLAELEKIKETSQIGNEYLDKTMINVDNEQLKNNRIAMINILAKRIKQIFDVKEIVR